jgi:hypothetical protein
MGGNMSQTGVNNAIRSTIKRDRFVRIAERRVNKIIDNFDLLGKCSNRRNYEYSEEEVRKIFREINRKVKEIRLQFQSEARNKGKFKL